MTQAVANLDEDERSMFKIGRQGNVNIINEYDKQNLLVAGFGNRGVICINESGLYQATLESTKTAA